MCIYTVNVGEKISCLEFFIEAIGGGDDDCTYGGSRRNFPMSDSISYLYVVVRESKVVLLKFKF